VLHPADGRPLATCTRAVLLSSQQPCMQVPHPAVPGRGGGGGGGGGGPPRRGRGPPSAWRRCCVLAATWLVCQGLVPWVMWPLWCRTAGTAGGVAAQCAQLTWRWRLAAAASCCTAAAPPCGAWATVSTRLPGLPTGNFSAAGGGGGGAGRGPCWWFARLQSVL
jgi:hypothetical protein